MFVKTRRIYEVLTYRDPDGEPYGRDTSTRKAEALRTAKRYAATFARVEVNALFVDENDENDILGADLLAAYENGVKTTK